jgi:DNA-binding response OmpR family regulator
MSEIDYSRANVLLFDPIHVNQRTTRYTLFEVGFRQIECVSNLAEFKAALTETSPTLILAESSANDTDIFKIVRSVRRSEIGSNPFVLFVLTTWSRDQNHIRSSIECGSDDVIVRPFSTAFALDRIKALVSKRKGFVVTSEYIGPDRRKSKSRENSAPSVEVPNLLKATVEGDEKALAASASLIKEAHTTISTERMRRLAMRIVVSLELNLANMQEIEPVPMKLDVNDLERTARELKAQLLKAKRLEAAEVAEALIDQVVSLRTEGGPDERAMRLTKELAMGAFAAYANGDSIELAKNEIGNTVSNLRRRIDDRAEAAAIKKAKEKDASLRPAAKDAGQDAAPGIKRAAM